MPLTPAQQNAVRAIVAQEGIATLVNDIQQLVISDRKAAAITSLAPAISVTVNNWPALAAYVAQQDNLTLGSVMADITAAATAQNAANLGPLFVQLYAACKAHFNL